MSEILPLSMQRNADFLVQWELAGQDDGAHTSSPINVANSVILMQVRDRLNNTILIDQATIEITDGPNGKFETRLTGGQGTPLGEYGDALQDVQLPYDLVVIDADGYKLAVVSGYLTIQRGISSTATNSIIYIDDGSLPDTIQYVDDGAVA